MGLGPLVVVQGLQALLQLLQDDVCLAFLLIRSVHGACRSSQLVEAGLPEAADDKIVQSGSQVRNSSCMARRLQMIWKAHTPKQH